MALLLALSRVSRMSIRVWQNACQELKDDLKNTRWLRGFGWWVVFIWHAGLVVSAIYIGIATITPKDTAYQPDGYFTLRPDGYGVWSSSGFFQITLGDGHFTFVEAKVIDIVWDIVSCIDDQCYHQLRLCRVSAVEANFF